MADHNEQSHTGGAKGSRTHTSAARARVARPKDDKNSAKDGAERKPSLGRGGSGASTAPATGPEARAERRERKQRRHERLSKTGKIILVAIGCLAMVLSVSAMACSGVINVATSDDQGYELTGGVAATVNGTNITEDTVTRQIMSMRQSYGYNDDKDWAQYLVDSGATPESLRENVINSYVSQLTIQQAIADNDIEVSDAEVDKAYDEAAAGYESQEAFESAISMYGYTPDTYREQLKSSLEQEKLREKVAPVDEPSDDEVLAYLNENLDTYGDARRSSHILFKVDSDGSNDEEQKKAAQDVLDKINAGDINFDDAAKEYSEDSSAENGGDVGWDCLTTFVTEYEDALKELDKGQVSGLVKSTYGYHIIKCTDVFVPEGEVESIDNVPEEIADAVRDALTSEEESTAYNEWYNEYKEGMDIVINDMPEDVPYNVDLSGVEPSTGSASADTSADSDETAEDSE